jgi:hypothetical protein
MEAVRTLEETVGTLGAMADCTGSAARFFEACGRRGQREDFLFTLIAAEMEQQAAHVRHLWRLVSCRPQAFSAGSGPDAETVEVTRRWIEQATELVRQGRMTHRALVAAARDVAGAVFLQRSCAIVEQPDPEFEDLHDELARRIRECYGALLLVAVARIAEPVPCLRPWQGGPPGSAARADKA